MSYDVKYWDGRDNEMNSDTNNYQTFTGATSKAARLLMGDYKLIDGIPFGNRARLALQRETDSVTNRELLKRYIQDAVKPLVDSGEIRDLVVTIDDPVGADGVAAKVEFYDVRFGDTSALGVIAPWAIGTPGVS